MLFEVVADFEAVVVVVKSVVVKVVLLGSGLPVRPELDDEVAGFVAAVVVKVFVVVVVVVDRWGFGSLVRQKLVEVLLFRVHPVAYVDACDVFGHMTHRSSLMTWIFCVCV